MKHTFITWLCEDVDIKFQYHDELNPQFWHNEKLDRKVRTALLKIADRFVEFIKLPKGVKVTDIIFTGSLANFNYTEESDIDLHIIVSIKESDTKNVDVTEYFKDKKQLWNDNHEIFIYDHPVELYVQVADEPLVATGIYSVKNDKWKEEPKHITKMHVDKYAIEMKAQGIIHQIENAIKHRISNADQISKIMDKIKSMRKSGLHKSGEFSVENLAFKALRNNGWIDKLQKLKKKVIDNDLSLD